MATITIDIKAIEHLIESLRLKDRIRLLKDLENKLWKERFDEVTTRIRRQVKEKGITDKEIDRICEEVRKERYAKNKSSY